MKLSADRRFWFLLLLCCMALAAPLVLRLAFAGGLWIGEESYYNIHAAELIRGEGFLPLFDSLSFGGREFIGSYGVPLLVSLNIGVISYALPVILGIACLVLFYALACRLFDRKIGFLASLLLIFSPPFVYLFSTVNEFGVSLVLFLAGVLFLFRKRDFLAWMFFFLIIFFSVKSALFVWVLAFFYYLKERESGFAYLSVLYVLFLAVRYFKLFFRGVPEFLVFEHREEFFSGLLNVIFSDFGGYFGFGFFFFVLALVGVALVWASKYKYLLAYGVLLVVLWLIYYMNFVIYFANLAVAVLGAYALVKLCELKWKSEMFRFLVVLVLVCGLVFSSASFFSRIGFFPPSQDEGVVIDFLRDEAGDFTVFSHYTRGRFINYAGKKNVMDNDFFYAPDLNERWADSERMFHSNYLKEIEPLIEKYDVLYIWVDEELKERIWGRSDVELLDLMRRDGKGFIKVYGTENVELWGLR